MAPHDVAVCRLQPEHVVTAGHAPPLGQDGQCIAAPGHGHADAQLRIAQHCAEIFLHLMEKHPLLLTVNGSIKSAGFLKAGPGKFRARDRLPLLRKQQFRLLAQHRITEITVINLHDFFRPGRQVCEFILHRNLGTIDRDADRPLQLKNMPEKRCLPDDSPDCNLISVGFGADLFRRQAVIAAVHGLPFPAAVTIAGAGRAKAAGIQKAAREGVQEFILIRCDDGGTVIAVFAHPGHIDAPVTGLSDVQAGVRQKIQLKAARRAYFNDLCPPGFSLRCCQPAQGIELTGIADITFSLFFQHCLISLSSSIPPYSRQKTQECAVPFSKAVAFLSGSCIINSGIFLRYFFGFFSKDPETRRKRHSEVGLSASSFQGWGVALNRKASRKSPRRLAVLFPHPLLHV